MELFRCGTTLVLLLVIASSGLAATLRVPSDFPSIQGALDAAGDGDVVLVQPGEYVIQEPIDFNRLRDPADPARAAVKNLTLKSEGGADRTMIRMSESPLDALRGSVVVFKNGEGRDSVLEGFTLTGGKGAIWEEYGVLYGGGGIFCAGSSPAIVRCDVSGNSDGILCYESASPTILDSVISRNRVGGITCFYSSSPTITGCTISENLTAIQPGGREWVLAGGVYCQEGSAPVLTDCAITGNAAGGLLCILSATPSVTDCRITGNLGGGAWCLLDSHATFTRTTISNNAGTITFAGGLNCSLSSPTLEDCELAGNYVGGILCTNSSSPRLTGCTISGNIGWADGGGFYCEEASSPVLEDCILHTNSTRGRGGGIFCRSGSRITLDHCTVAGNSSALRGGGLFCEGDGSAVLSSSIVWGNIGGAIEYDSVFPEVIHSCIEADPVWPGAGNINSAPAFCGWATGPEVFVDPSRPEPGDGSEASPYTRLGSALSYSLALSSRSPCLGTGEGGADMGADTGTCDAPGVPTLLVRLAAGTYSLRGLALTHGASLEGPDEGQAVLEGTVFGLRTGATLSRVSVANGHWGGIVIGPGEGPEVRSSSILNNAGGGVHCSASSTPRLTNCTITGNFAKRAGGGVECAADSAPVLANCIVVGNFSWRSGGGIQCRTSSSPTLVNCTVAGNSAAEGGGLHLEPASALRLMNSIIWGNPGGSIAPSGDSRVEASYSCLEGEAPLEGEGNIRLDPLFAGPGTFDFTRISRVDRTVLDYLELPDFVLVAGDYHLGDGSPCLNAARTDDAPATDIEGNARPCDGRADMGAHERCGPDQHFRRGDANADGVSNISDAIVLLAYLFQGGDEPPCLKAMDVDDGGKLEITDAIYLLNHLFLGGARPAEPFEACGQDPTPDELACHSFPGCP